MSEKPYRIAYNVEKRRPGCIMLQVIMRGTVPNFQSLFPSETWLTNPDGMQVFTADEEELKKLSEITLKALKRK